MNNKTIKIGFSLVEAILAGALFLILSLSLVSAILYGQEGMALAGKRSRAVYLAEEGLEAVRNIQAESFSNLTAGTYGLATSSGRWSFLGSSDAVGIFSRQIVISDIDSQKKSVSVGVSWSENAQRSDTVNLSTTLTNWRALTIGNWANPNTLDSSLDLSGNNDGWRVAVSGNYAYVVRITNTANFAVIDISNPAAPALVSNITIPGNLRDVAVAGNYAYVASSNGNREMMIYDISNPAAPTLVSSYNASGGADAYSVAVLGTVAYLGRATGGDPEFSALNVSNPASVSLLGTIQLTGTVNEIALSGNYAYLASSNTAQELQVVNIANPASMSLVGTYNAAGNGTGNDVALSGNVLSLALSTNSVALLNITTPSSPALYSSVAIGGSATGVSLGNNGTYLFVSSANGAAELQVFDISNPAVSVLVGDYNAASVANDVAYDSNYDRACLTTINDSAELIIIAP